MWQWLLKFLKGFLYAFSGVGLAFKERNMRVHGVAFVTVVVAGLYFQIEPWEWVAIFLISGAVMSAEIVNTSLEYVCNTLRDTLHVSYAGTKEARDLAAGAVVVLAVMAVGVAGVIFGPRLVALL